MDLIRDRLAALIDPSGSITRKLREAPFPLQSFAPQVVWNLAGRWEEEKEKKRREAAAGPAGKSRRVGLEHSSGAQMKRTTYVCNTYSGVAHA